MADAQKIASHIVLLDKGRVVAAGSIGDLRAQVGCAEATLEEVFLRLLRTDASRAVA
jgi:ABC-type Na+ transport system ATPase subunit NatA